MQFILVRRDMTGYRHSHLVQAADGTWSVRVRLPEAGVYRLYADSQVAGVQHVQGVDLFAPGKFRPEPPAPTSQSGQTHIDATGQLLHDRVTLHQSGLKAGREAMLTFRGWHGGQPVTDLQPYLVPKGLLVGLRVGDLAYLHVRPDAARVAPHEITHEIRFIAGSPTAGAYRLFFQFRRDDPVRTVACTQEVPR